MVRRLRRVVRSTFAAEINALLDAIESLIILQLAMHQIQNGTAESAEQLMEKLEMGGLSPPIEACIDARSVFDAIAASDVTTPQEATLKLHLVSIRNRIENGVLKRLWWVDTRDMVADALTKGGIDRKLLTSVMQGNLSLQYDFVKHENTKLIKLASSNFPINFRK